LASFKLYNTICRQWKAIFLYIFEIGINISFAVFSFVSVLIEKPVLDLIHLNIR